jgi:hypothetical protein
MGLQYQKAAAKDIVKASQLLRTYFNRQATGAARRRIEKDILGPDDVAVYRRVEALDLTQQNFMDEFTTLRRIMREDLVPKTGVHVQTARVEAVRTRAARRATRQELLEMFQDPDVLDEQIEQVFEELPMRQANQVLNDIEDMLLEQDDHRLAPLLPSEDEGNFRPLTLLRQGSFPQFMEEQEMDDPFDFF